MGRSRSRSPRERSRDRKEKSSKRRSRSREKRSRRSATVSAPFLPLGDLPCRSIGESI